MDLRLLARWAATHHGLITLDLARRHGLSGASWYRAARSGRIEVLHPGVARLPGSEDTFEQRAAAAWLAAGRDALTSHRTAARLWGVERPDREAVDLTVPRLGYRLSLDGVVIHRPRDRDDLEPSWRSGIATTNPLRMLCDLGAVDPAAVPSAVERIIVAGFARPSALHALVTRHARPGRTGIAALRDAVAAWPLGDKPADSVLEPALSRLLRSHGLPPARFHAIIEGFEVDFLVVGTPLVIECDGWEHHGAQRQRWQRDRERDAVLSAAGYVTLRLTFEQITRHPTATARRIEAVLRRWAPHSLVATSRSGAPR